MIKNIKVLFDDPGMIEVEFEPVDQKIIEKLYNPSNFEQVSYENLHVEFGRLKLSNSARDTDNYKLLTTHFDSMFKTITKTLIDIDKIRFPIFSDFNTWWDKNNLQRKKALMLVLDKPGFSQPYHLDNRFSMWAGSINLADNNTKTIFSKENTHWMDQGHDPKKRYYQASGKKWTGTFWLNTENNWHGVPLVKEDRRAIICNLMLAS